uniref:Uncharacterized protein n=1 Tax=Sphaerodactylus townsendi TaxID=933632 RepID=A0ACB8EQH7_9SAUR
MRMMENEYANDANHVYDIRTLLEGEAVTWLVGLFEEEEATELRAFDRFMISVCCWFEGHFLEEKAHVKLQHLKQGPRLCLHCREASHLIANCPEKHDPEIRWQDKLVQFTEPPCAGHIDPGGLDHMHSAGSGHTPDPSGGPGDPESAIPKPY